MTYYLWRIKVFSDTNALWFMFIAINKYIMNEPLNKKFKLYLSLFGRKIIGI